MADDARLLSLIQGSDSSLRAKVTLGADANPDDAAQSIDLASTTGVPSSVVNADLDNFNKNYKASLARDLVLGNPQLREYVNSHPLAAQVSNDDWGNLDKISKSSSLIGNISKMLGSVWQQGVGEAEIRGFKEGFGEGPIFPVTREGLAQQYPALDPSRPPFGAVASSIAAGGLNLSDLLLRGTSGIFSAITSGVGAGVGAVAGEQAGKEAKALTEYEVIKPEGAIHAGAIGKLDGSQIAGTFVEAVRRPGNGHFGTYCEHFL